MGDAEESCRQAVFGGGSESAENGGGRSSGTDGGSNGGKGGNTSSRNNNSVGGGGDRSSAFSDASALEAMTGVVNEDGVTLLAARAVAPEAELEGR